MGAEVPELCGKKLLKTCFGTQKWVSQEFFFTRSEISCRMISKDLFPLNYTGVWYTTHKTAPYNWKY